MVLKGLTCYHMIVITHSEGEAGKTRSKQQTLRQEVDFPLGFSLNHRKGQTQFSFFILLTH